MSVNVSDICGIMISSRSERKELFGCDISYGFRPNRCAQQAILTALDMMNKELKRNVIEKAIAEINEKTDIIISGDYDVYRRLTNGNEKI